MQRCPECDFIYEDDQHVCDMDGTNLVYDFSEVPQNPSFQLARGPDLPRLFALVAIPGLALWAVLFVVSPAFKYGPAPQSAGSGLPSLTPSSPTPPSTPPSASDSIAFPSSDNPTIK